MTLFAQRLRLPATPPPPLLAATAAAGYVLIITLLNRFLICISTRPIAWPEHRIQSRMVALPTFEARVHKAMHETHHAV